MGTKAYRIEIIDLCGRTKPRVVDLFDADDVASTDLTDDDLDHIIDMHLDGRTAYIGEFEYRKLESDLESERAA